jgi:hypothetical protein
MEVIHIVLALRHRVPVEVSRSRWRRRRVSIWEGWEIRGWAIHIGPHTGTSITQGVRDRDVVHMHKEMGGMIDAPTPREGMVADVIGLVVAVLAMGPGAGSRPLSGLSCVPTDLLHRTSCQAWPKTRVRR